MCRCQDSAWEKTKRKKDNAVYPTSQVPSKIFFLDFKTLLKFVHYVLITFNKSIIIFLMNRIKRS